jgi:CRISPR-associated protein Cmr2
MHAVQKAKGEIVFPYVHNEAGEINDPLLAAIDSQDEGLANPWVGSLPNRFQAKLDVDTDPTICVQAVDRAWQRIANVIYEKVVKRWATEETERIWHRQVKSFWEISWVIGEDSNLLDRRKNWRSHIVCSEGGDKCTLLPYLQELSGGFRSSHKQKTFWEKVRRSFGEVEIGEHERLSAIGLIKRMFPLYTKEAIGWQFPKQAIYFPSTHEFALRAWRQEAERIADDEEDKQKADKVTSLIRSFEDEALKAGFPLLTYDNYPLTKWSKWRSFRREAFELAFTQTQQTPQVTEQMVSIIQKINQTIGFQKEPYYAILLMDGDRLGDMLQNDQLGADRGKKISQALAAFTQQVAPIVEERLGSVIYAGGDDVLALLPIDRAIDAAFRLRQEYENAFATFSGKPTISAAVMFVHIRAPLKQVLQRVHSLLDDVAKTETGRNSFAMATWKGSGEDEKWSAPWDVIQTIEDGNLLQALIKQICNQDNMVTSQFFYKLQTYKKFFRFSNQLENKNNFVQLLRADYLRIYNQEDNEDIRKYIDSLQNLCFRSWIDEDKKLHKAEGAFTANGALILHWLAQKGVWGWLTK